jgi:hypothetical protein
VEVSNDLLCQGYSLSHLCAMLCVRLVKGLCVPYAFLYGMVA